MKPLSGAHVCVCICTFKRPALLRHALNKLAEQETARLFTFSVVVTDNDKEQSAKSVVSGFRLLSSLEVLYCVEPEQNIALARNRGLSCAHGDYVAFIDDDEFPEPTWLISMLKACQAPEVDGVLGPVRPFFEELPPAWLIKGGFCERPEHLTGYNLTWRQTRTGNVMFKRRIVEGISEPFRRLFGNGGEDQDFFRRMMICGHRFIWCNEAVVYEIVPPERWKRTYLLRRAFLRGQNERHNLSICSVITSILAASLYTLMLPFLILMGQSLFVRYAIRLMDHLGKLFAVLNLRLLGDKYLHA